MTHRLALATLVALLSCTAAAHADEQPTQDFSRPPYQVLRFNEDWSGLAGRDTSTTGDFFDPIKHVPLADGTALGDVWASFGGSARQRLEYWGGFNFGAPAAADNEDLFLLTRLFLHGDFHVGEHLRFFFEGKSALSTERDLVGGLRTLDVDTLDLQNAFAEVTLPAGDYTLTLRAGRQELLFGKQRLVSPLDWSNTRRAWDGFTGSVRRGDWTVTAFWTRFAPVQKYSFNDSEPDAEFFGVYATGKCPVTNVGVDLYWLGLSADAMAFAGSPYASYNGTVGDEDRHTVGGRLFGPVGKTGFDYDVEGAYQFGEVGDGDVSAFFVAAQLGYTFKDCPTQPRAYVGAGYASGDESPGGDVETFNQLFPLGHAYLGYIDTVGRQNVIDFSAGVAANLTKKLSVALDGHYFRRAESSDALYNAGGGVVRAGTLDDSKDIGAEIDLTVKYTVDRHLTLTAGYSHFFPGDFIENTGPDDSIDFAYFQWQYNF